MSRAIVPLAQHAEPGMYVRKQVPGGPNHMITEVRDVDAQRVEITTTSGRWTFLRHEVVVFPRRPDGSIRNWFAEGVTPASVTDLAVGDILPPDRPDPRVDEVLIPLRGTTAMDQQVEAWGRETQIVTAIHGDRNDPFFKWWISVRDIMGSRKHPFFITEPVTFPRPPRLPGEIKPTAIVRPYTGHGPYVSDTQIVFFAVHPFGRGRWPQALIKGIPLGDDVLLIRDPGSRKSDWEQWQYAGRPMERHPRDPNPLAPGDLDEIPAAVELYEQYLDRRKAYNYGEAPKPTEQ